MTAWEWGKEYSHVVEKIKNNIMSMKASHFGSTVYYNPFGDKGKFGMVNESSTGQYIIK